MNATNEVGGYVHFLSTPSAPLKDSGMPPTKLVDTFSSFLQSWLEGALTKPEDAAKCSSAVLLQ
jgi:hypothetical protein